jgi:intracellular multiplication protein IcmO
MAGLKPRSYTGVQEHQRVDIDRLTKNTNTVPQRLSEWFHKPVHVVMTIMIVAGAAWWYSEAATWFLLLGILLTFWGCTRPETIPLKMPIQSKLLDPNQPHPSTGLPSKGEGIFFLGNDTRSGKEVWLTNSDCRQHFLVLGTTGAGKTESLLGFAANALSWGSGFLFCDGKGDVSLFAKVYAMARRFGRTDDLLVLNFMGGSNSTQAGKVASNTLNPFASGSDDELTQMVVSLMDDVGGDGAMWKGRATAMLTGIMRALCWLRDQGYLDLNVSEIRDHMALRRIIDLSDEQKHPDLPAHIRKSIRSYLTSLPGYVEEKKEKQAQTTLDQHGYLEMQFTKILGSLADVYGYIFATPFGEVDMYDVVLNRRILIIMLPALKKSGDEIANLGKIVVATLKGMMGDTLGSELEGSWDDVVENRPTTSPSPFLCILDEVGYYTVEGMALMAAQARSLGFSMIYASQDLPAMKRLNEKEAASIIANTNTKIFMRTEEPNETAKLAIDRGDKAIRVQTKSFERKSGDLIGTHFAEDVGANLETADRITLTDLTAQGEGEMHIVFQDKIVRAKGLYANPEGSVDKGKLRLRANHFVKVPKPSLSDMRSREDLPKIMERLLDPHTPEMLREEEEKRLAGVPEMAEAGDEIAMAARTFERALTIRRKPVEAACAALADVLGVLKGMTDGFSDDVRSNYAIGPIQPRGFDPHDFEIPSDNVRDTYAGFPGMQDDEPEHDGRREGGRGVSMAANVPPPLSPRQQKPFPGVRKPQRVDPKVPHGASVNDANLVDMVDRVTSSDAIMRSLAQLNFDGEGTTTEQVERNLSGAIGNLSSPASAEKLANVTSGFERADAVTRAAARMIVPMPSDDDDEFDMDEDDDEGGGPLVTSFLEKLLIDQDDDKKE